MLGQTETPTETPTEAPTATPTETQTALPTATPTVTPPNFTVFHTDPTSSGGIDTTLVDQIRASSGSGNTIDVCIYNIDLDDIVEALVDAKTGGATVRVISDADSAYADAEYTQWEDEYGTLVAAGIEVRTNALSKTGIMHNKFVVFDGERVWTGSWNATNTATNSDSNDAIIIYSAALAQEYTDEFEEMWGGEYGTYKEDDTEHHFTIDGVTVDSYFAPSDGVKDVVLSEINSATSSIHFLMYSFTDKDIADAMIQKATAATPIPVTGVLDNGQGQGAYSQLTNFTRNSVPVKLDTFSGLLHNKLIIIDREGPDPRVITGSFNLTDAAEEKNDENIIVVRSQAVASSYYSIFDHVYSQHAAAPPAIAQGRLVISEVLSKGFFRFFNIWDSVNWGPSSDEDSTPGDKNVVDAVPPQIIHTPVTDVLVNRPVYIHCSITDNAYLYSAKEPTLHYRAVADPPQSFTAIPMGALNDEYYGKIPTTLTGTVGSDRIEYYITAKDASHNRGSHPAVNPELHPHSVNVQAEGDDDKLVFTEIMYDPPSTPEVDYEWVEVMNTSTQTVSLNNWKFTDFDGTYQFPSDATIGGGEYRILCNTQSAFNTAHPGVSQGIIYEYGDETTGGDITLLNSWATVTGSIALINPSDLIVSEVDYSSGWGAQNGSGPNKNTLEKIDPAGPDDGTNWMHSMVRGGTPGQASSPHYIFTRYETGEANVVTRPGPWLSKTLIDHSDPQEAGVTVSYRLDRACNVNVKIYNPPVDPAPTPTVPPENCYDSQYLVRTLYVTPMPRAENMDISANAHEAVWDGKNASGTPVAGVCRVVLEAENGGTTCRTESDDTVAAASWVAYDPDGFALSNRQLVSVLYSLTKPAHMTLGFKYKMPQETVWQYITLLDGELCPRPAGSPLEIASKSVSNSYLWDGTNNAGNYVSTATDYKIFMEAEGDIYGNAVICRFGELQIPSLVLDPRSSFDPSTQGNEVEQIKYELTKAANVTVTVMDSDGEPVQTVFTGSQTSGQHTELYWDGKDESHTNVVEDGRYMIVVRADTGEGETYQAVAESVVFKIHDPNWTPVPN